MNTTTSPEMLVEARHVTVRYGSKRAVDDVSFSIPKGRVVGLLGHNGAGKTTLMKAMVGLAAAEGELAVLGLTPRRQRVPLLEQAWQIMLNLLIVRMLVQSFRVYRLQQISPNCHRNSYHEN